MPEIPKEFITRLTESCDIGDIISAYVPLKRAGRISKGLCPFHSEKTPSFCVYHDTQSFYCFGCGVGGDVITFIKKAENLSYVEAIHSLARKMGMAVPEGKEDVAAKRRKAILEINRETARFYHRVLRSQAGAPGYQYLRGRGLSDEIIIHYGLGFAPDSFHALIDHLKEKGFSEPDIEAAAVAKRSSKGNLYDLFRNRVMFPIIDLAGNVIAFGGRVMDDSKPKYLNSPETLVFKKSKNLFSLNFARKENTDTLILAEGYMDVISMYAAGFHNVVATLGTALTPEQARIIAKYAKQVILSYDADEAGQKAIQRAMNLFSEVGLSTNVLHMEGAKDPDEYIKKFGADRFRRLLNESLSVMDFELSRIRSKYHLELAEDKIAYMREASAAIAQMEDSVSRSVYAGTVAAECGIDAQTLIGRINTIRRSNKKKEQQRQIRETIAPSRTALSYKANPQKAEFEKESAAEEMLLSLMLHRPDLTKSILHQIPDELFVTDFNRRLLSILRGLDADGQTISLPLLNAQLEEDERTAVSAFLARYNEFAAPDKILFDCKARLEETQQNRVQSGQAISAEQFQRLKEKKRR